MRLDDALFIRTGGCLDRNMYFRKNFTIKTRTLKKERTLEMSKKSTVEVVVS